MAQRPTRSLRHEYDLYVEQEIENYKESIPRSVLLGIGDDAVAALAKLPQFALTELLLCEEVDRLIFKRLRLPAYTTWRNKRLTLHAELRRPEHWTMTADASVIRDVGSASQTQVLVAGAPDTASALYLAANGCNVTALEAEPDAVERVVHAAVQAGLTERVQACVGDLASWLPGERLSAVIVTPSAFAGLTTEERSRVMTTLQGATIDGGVHLVQTIAASGKRAITLEELRSTYRGWAVTVERRQGKPNVFLARKGAA